MKQLELKKINACLVYIHKIPEKHLMSGKLTDSDLKLLDEYVEHIFEIIDESDYVFYNMDDDKYMLKYLKELNYEYYDKIFINKPNGGNRAHYVFDIRDKKSKKMIKEKFKYKIPNDYIKIKELINDKERFNTYWNSLQEIINNSSFCIYSF